MSVKSENGFKICMDIFPEHRVVSYMGITENYQVRYLGEPEFFCKAWGMIPVIQGNITKKTEKERESG